MRLETERLILREWLPEDFEPYASFMGDPLVRRFYPDVLTRAQSDAAIGRYIDGLAHDGFGFLAVERKSDGRLMGDVGLGPVDMPIRGNPPVEIGWLLGSAFWGNGYAVEAARAWMQVAFEQHGLGEVVSWTSRLNLPSQRVMQKLGMTSDAADDFLHPRVPDGHPLKPHVLYRATRPTAA